MVRKLAAVLFALALLTGCMEAEAATIEPCQPFPGCTFPGGQVWLPQVSK